MLSAQRSLYDSVWKTPVAEIKSVVGKEKKKEWWNNWCSECPEEAKRHRDHGHNVVTGWGGCGGKKKVFWIEPWPRDWWRAFPRAPPQECAFRCLNRPLTYDERMGFGAEGSDQTWLRRFEDEEKDNECRSHVQHSRQKHFSRKRNYKKVLKKKKRSAWINKKASKKRRK